MSSLHPFGHLDPFSCHLCREPVFTKPRFSSSIRSPLPHALVSGEDNLDFEFDILFDFPRSYCLRHHRQNHLFPMLLSSAESFDAAVDQLGTLELGLDQGIGPCFAPERKWKWTAEIKGKKGEGFEQKYKCTAETKNMRWTVEYEGKGKHSPLSRICAFHSAAQDDCERAYKKEKKVERDMARHFEIDEGTNHQGVFKRKASAKRTMHRNKGKKKELSPQDAAMAIQKTFRDHMSRRSLVLRSLRDLAVAKSRLKEIRASFSNFSYRHRISKDAEERQRFSEKIIVLLLTADAIEGEDYMVLSAKRSMTRELEAMLEAVDPQPYRDLGTTRRRNFDLPAVGALSTKLASGVADVVRLLDQDDGSSNILPDFSL